MIPWLTLAALAAPERRYALEGTVAVPHEGSVRIDLGPEWVARCPDPSTYLLVDPTGREIPYAGRTSDASPPGRERLTWEPMEVSPSRWQYLVHSPASGAPTRALSVRGVPRGYVVRAVVSREGREVTRALVWNLPDTGAGVSDEIPLPPDASSGPWQIELRTVTFWRWRPWAEFEAVTEQVEEVATVLWPVDTDPPIAVSVSESRLTLPLPRGGLPVRGVRLVATDRVFSRPVVVRDGTGAMLGDRRLERFTIGEESIDVDRVPVHATPSRSLVLDVTDDRSVPLQVARAEIELRGLALLVPVASAGDWTVYGCGPAGQSYDVERLADKLANAATPRVRPSSPVPNAGWTAALVVDGVAGPGQPAGRSSVVGRIEGPAGLVRIRLAPEVLSATANDLGDLRITTPGGLQLPYLTEDGGAVAVAGLTWSERQEGPVTVVDVGLPSGGLPLEQLVLHAERGRFRRTVEVRGERSESVRASWDGTGDEVSRLVVPLSGWGAGRLEVRIDNGANAPLPLLPPTVSMGTSDAWLVLPPEGAMVSVGTVSSRPRYDLELVRSEVIDGPALPATIVAEAPVREAPRVAVRPVVAGKPAPYRWATALIGACAVAIGAMTWRLVRTGEEE